MDEMNVITANQLKLFVSLNWAVNVLEDKACSLFFFFILTSTMGMQVS